ncbi:MAG TPA: type IV pilus assembly protein PilM [Candidatus Baltobacteraceae bacterium]|jgi:type IV pilus assembly protein PilM|nr:type IV pilus assembly protein PilM [Candidatus Baltobacteraceae bacterium]
MLNSKSFLAVDFGAGSLKLAEFEPNEAGGLRLKQYGIKPLGLEGAQEATREAAMQKALQELLAEKSYSARQVNACAPGFHVFSKFVKLPPVDTSKVTQIIRYEAQQNVPFPLDQVVWDYQILGTSATNELEVLLVAVKSEIVEGLFRVAEGAGLRLKLVDASPAALCNAFRYNYGDLEGCTMLLDIGAKTSNLLFFEKGKVYSRSINIGANSITQDFANEAKLKFPEAEAVKIEKGSVSLGGAYEEPEDPRAAAIAKIARQVMTRLHIQVNQTIQFFRGQQGGSAPQRLFLSGGASIMPYTAQFFAEKLNVPVEYFNPFRNIEIDPSLDLDELSKYAHSYGEVVGLGLRDLAHCPVELNLMPQSSIQRQEFGGKKPYLIASVFALALVVFVIYIAQKRIGDVLRDRLDKAKEPLATLTQKNQQLAKAVSERDALKKQADQMKELADSRFAWLKVLTELRSVLMQAESAEKTNLFTADNAGVNTDVGVWVETFNPVLANGNPFLADEGGGGGGGGGGGRSGRPGYRGRYGNRAGAAARPMPSTTMTTPSGPTVGEITDINLLCRGINRTTVSPTANTDLAFLVQQGLTNNPAFKSANLVGNLQVDDSNTNTFTFSLLLKLTQPIKL